LNAFRPYLPEKSWIDAAACVAPSAAPAAPAAVCPKADAAAAPANIAMKTKSCRCKFMLLSLLPLFHRQLSK
jgi:hypothetical protein